MPLALVLSTLQMPAAGLLLPLLLLLVLVPVLVLVLVLPLLLLIIVARLANDVAPRHTAIYLIAA